MSRRIVFVLVLATTALALVAAEGEGPVYLARGPHPGRGLWFLSPNTIAYDLGEYRDGDSSIYVYYTDEEIVPGSAWAKGDCSQNQTLLLPSSDALMHFFDSGEGWAVFFEMPPGYEQSCGFIEVFLRRLGYFKSVTAPGSGVPLPAILEL